MKALSLHITGIVQGVGFRPFVYNLALEQGLTGWVLNASDGVHTVVEGDPATVDAFPQAIRDRAPAMAVIETITAEDVEPEGFRELRHPRVARRGRRDDARLTRHRNLPRVRGRALRPERPPLPLPLHQLHQLRPALHHHRRRPLRPPHDLDARLPHVPRMRRGVRRPRRPPLPRATGCVLHLRPEALPQRRRRPLRLGLVARARILAPPPPRPHRGGRPLRRDRRARRRSPPRRPHPRHQGPRRLPPRLRRNQPRSRHPPARAQAPLGQAAGNHGAGTSRQHEPSAKSAPKRKPC